MSRKPILTGFEDKFASGKDFSITRSEYIRLTGADIPQDKSYTCKKSAIAKMATGHGYHIEVIPETLKFKKIDQK